MKKLFLIALAASLFVAACELPTESPKLPGTQNFTVTENWVCGASDYYLNGVLTIAEGGSITFTGSTLHVNGNDAQNGVDVYGSATFEETTVTSTSEALGEDDNYFFTVNEGATFSFENGEIKHCGADVTGKRSLVIEAEGATIYNSNFSSNGLNLVVETDGVNASKNNFGQTGIDGHNSISLKGLNLIFEDNGISGNIGFSDIVGIKDSTGSFSNNQIINTNHSGHGLGANNVNASSFKGLTLSAGDVAIRFVNCESNDASFIELTGNIGIGPKAKDNVLDLTVVGSGNLNEFDSMSEGTTIRGGKYSEIKAKLGESTKNVLVGVEFDEDAVLYGEEILEVRDSQFVGTKGVKISNECSNAEECTQMVFSGNALGFPAAMGVGGGVMQDADGLNALLTINGSNLLIEDNDLDAGEGTAYYFKNAGDVEVTAGETSGKRLAYFEGSNGVTLEQEPGATGFSLKQELKRISFAHCSCWTGPEPQAGGLGWCCVALDACVGVDSGNGVREACQECQDYGNDLETKEWCADAYAGEKNDYGDECSGEDAVKQYSCDGNSCVAEPVEYCPDGTHCDDGACVSDDVNCGDGFCTHPETCTTCAEDCGDCFDANPAIVFEESNECSVKNFDFSGPVLVHATAGSNQNKVEQNSFEEAKIVLEGYANAFNENVFTGQCNLTLYGDYSEVAYNAFKELNDFQVIGRNANVTGNTQSNGLAGSGDAVILVTGKNAAFTNNEFLVGAEITGPGGVVGSEDKFYFADTVVASLELGDSALVEWVSGETGGVTFADESSRLRRGWNATLKFIDNQREKVELAEDFVITDAKGNKYVCKAGSATCDPGDLFEGVYSQEHILGMSSANKASFAGDWESGSYNPYSYDGGEFEVTGDGVIPIKLFFGGGLDDENPAGVFMEFTAPKRSQIAGDVEVQIVTQYNGENNCSDITLSVIGPHVVDQEFVDCANGVSTFLLEDLQTPGDYSLQAIASDYPSAGETSTASTTFKLIGSAPIATPDVHWLAALFAAAIGFYAFSKRK